MKRAIEEYFPIIDINRLAVPERNSFRPIYQMHKWFARRSSSVFRAILLAALKPAGTDIMEEFYKDHTNDPDTKGKVILDPFMGGGTTVVEALRLGCKVIGVDLNPVAWFIVKTEIDPVDIVELQKAFERLANRTVEWSGKPLKETLLNLYKTECPACGNKEADTIYTFWVKSAPCTDVTCKAHTPLFADYIISQKSPSIRYIPDYKCPHCDQKFDWEREPAAMVGEERLMINSGNLSAGIGRSNARWAYSNMQVVGCPWCNEVITARFKKPKLKRKKVPLSVLYCSKCEEVWQFRGELPQEVQCPTCKHGYNPSEGSYDSEEKRFTCNGVCGGNRDSVMEAIRTLPDDQLLRTRAYGLEGYCGHCASKNGSSKSQARELFDQEVEQGVGDSSSQDTGEEGWLSKSIIWKNNGKFFKRMSASDVQLYNLAYETWQREKEHLPFPQSRIEVGNKTKTHLIGHHYLFWHQLFNERQLLALSTLLKEIDFETDQTLKEMLLSAFVTALEGNNVFCRYTIKGGNKSQGIFARHDYHPKLTFTENNAWGTEFGHGTFSNKFNLVLEGKQFCYEPYDRKYIVDEKGENLESVANSETILPIDSQVTLLSQTSTSIPLDESTKMDSVITDPPYASNVNYSELADFFYVWLRLPLRQTYPQFTPELTPKAEEIIENPTRGKTALDFKEGLEAVFMESARLLRDDGNMVFTFHHAEDSAWEALLTAVCDAGFYIEAVYPIHGEGESSLHLQENEAISYDLIHVCRKLGSVQPVRRAWAGLKPEIRKQARSEAQLIQAGRYGHKELGDPDKAILLIGKCLELYSKHYGNIVDHEDKPVPIHRALEEIKMLVDQIVTKDQPLPPELADVDVPSYIYFTTLCMQKEIKGDDVSKSTRGIIESGELRARGLIIKGREKRGRTFEVKQPIERLDELKRKFHLEWPTEQLTLFADEGQPIMPKDFLFVDCIHLLLGLAEVGENLLPWLERFRGLRPQIRAALEYLSKRNPSFEPHAQTVLGLIDERGLLAIQNRN